MGEEPGLKMMVSSPFTKYAVVVLVAFLVTYLLTPLVIGWARRLGMVDRPDGRRIHHQTIPRGGGLAVFTGFHAGCLAVFCIPWGGFQSGLSIEWWTGFLPASLLMVVVGLVDDRYGVGAWVKLGCQVAAGLLLYAADIRFGALLHWPLPVALDLFLTVGWCVGFINAFNLIDGLDGLAAGLGLLAALGLAGALMLQRAPGDTLVLLALAAACLAFLRYNFHPARIFLGDTGSIFIGLTLAAISLGTSTKSAVATALAVPLLAAGVPILDTALAVWRRSLRRFTSEDQGHPVPNGEPGRPENGVMTADKEHLHHRLLQLLGSQRRVAWLLYGLNAGFILVALAAVTFASWSLGIYLLAFGVGAYVIVRHLAHVEMWTSGVVLARGLRRPSGKVIATLFYPVTDVALLTAAFAAGLHCGGSNPAGWDEIKRRLLEDGPLWIGFAFVAMAAVGAYRRVWSRARVSDFFLLGIALIFGASLAAVFQGRLDPLDATHARMELFIMVCLALPLTAGVRLAPRLLTDAVAYLGSLRSPDGTEPVRVLLYGAGYNCLLYLRSRTYSLDLDSRPLLIIGLADDDSNLKGRLLYGFKVLGGLESVPELVSRHRLDRIILTTRLQPEVEQALDHLAAEYPIELWQWETRLRPLRSVRAAPTPARHDRG